jgi:crotonobetainyl-CoA:carnitine CoA-transferase CaiB-like acyl-CoA transferase
VNTQAPAAGEAPGSQPLAGIRVLEVGAYISAPYAGSILASLGAEVVKVEPPQGDPFRRGEGADNDYFVQYNAGKKSLAVDLKSREGLDLVKALLPRFDVLIENMRPGKMAALGLGERDCRSLHPPLVYASVSGFGSGGPLRDRPAYDSIGQSYGGLFSVMSDPHQPRLTGTCMADLITGVSIGMGILAALVRRGAATAARGSLVETSLLESMSLLTVDALTQACESGEDPTRQSRHPHSQSFCMNTADGRGMVVHLSSHLKFWRGLVQAIEREELLRDARFESYAQRMKPECYRALAQILAEEFVKRPLHEWEDRLAAHDIPHAPVLTMHEYADHPQTEWLQLLGREPDGRTLARPPWRFDGERPGRDQPAPRVGQHTRELLRDIRAPQQLELLLANGVVAAGD